MADVGVSNILIVDDEPDVRFLVRRAFERAGHSVTEAGHGAAALEAVTAALPDLVVTDIAMPVMSGVEFIKLLRATSLTAAIPIMAVSGDPHLAGGADVVIPKPFHWQELLAVAEGLLAAKKIPPVEGFDAPLTAIS